MFRFVFVILVALECSVLFASAECDILKCDLPKHYRELACEPTKYAENDTDKCCPIEYNCDALMSQDATKCHYKGKVYSTGETIKTEDEPNCQVNCHCQGGHFQCASVECPEQVFNRPEPHCVIQSTVDKCCSSSIICDQPAIDALPSCYLNGKQYRQGEKMYPEGLRCFSCICDEGFDNSTAISKNSACSEVFCDIELHKSSDIRTGCVPVYYGEPTCCPISTKCPSAEVKKVPALTRNAANPDLKCKFGDHDLQIGDKVTDTNKCVDCECVVPPMVTCVQKRDC